LKTEEVDSLNNIQPIR